MYRSYKVPMSRRIRRSVRRIRPYQWFQYAGLVLLMMGAGFMVMAALQL